VCELRASGGRAGSIEAPATAAFPAVRARFFRVIFPRPARVTEIRLTAAERVVDWALKAGMAGRGGGSQTAPPQPAAPTAAVPSGSTIDPAAVVDLTARMDRGGRLAWDAPPGDWTILRFGHTSIGIENHPAPDGGGGLECDKYSRAAMDFHFEHFFGQLFSVIGPLAAKHQAGAIIDSYEVGMQTWTPAMPEEFQRRRGYDLRKYLPALTGRVVAGGNISDRFLWDVRRTYSDLMADNYYGRFAELCRQHGMKAYTEPYSGGPFDEMQSGAKVDVPMGEFWLARNTPVNRSVKLAASVAHVNGRAIVGAESFTGFPTFAKWQEAPSHLKAQGDWMYTQGLNQFIFHRYAHQPHPDAVPGMTMGQWGFHFDRTNTWWGQARAWLGYAARCQSLLRQGLFVADLVYFEGETAPKAAPAINELGLAPPQGYDWDTIDRHSLLTRLRVERGRIFLPDGVSYAVMVLAAGENTMTLEVLRKLHELVEQGMTLVGARPAGTPSLSGYPANDAEFHRLADELWGDLDASSTAERRVGQGRVFWAQPLRAVLDAVDIRPDFELTARSADAPVNFIHRRAGAADIYFVANRRRRSEDLVCTFRVENRRPEFWQPDTGEIVPAAVYDLTGHGVRVPIRLDPSGSVFVVFRSPAPSRRIVSVARGGATLLGTMPFAGPSAGLHRDVTNSFTIAFWAKPDTDIDLPGGTQAAAVPASFAIFPPGGAAVYGAGHAACGMVLGRNGACIYERTRGNPLPVLAVPSPIAGWSHFAIVYRDGAPSLHVNGQLLKTGQKSEAVVHPGLDEAYQRDGAWYFEGDMTGPELFREALTESRIRALVAAGVPWPDDPSPVEAAGTGDALLFWQDGSYQLRDAAGRESPVRISGAGKAIEVAGPWRVAFPPDLGAPAEIVLPKLMSLHKHPQEGVRYFSGTTAYSARFVIDAAARDAGRRLFLDLGRVEVIADVKLNGRDLGILWKPPFRVDITDAVRAGDNDLEIRVTNLWPNRLIGDEHLPPENQYGAATVSGAGGGGMAIRELPGWYLQGKPKPPGGRVTFTTWKHFDKDSPLLESGLLGPVLVRAAVRLAIET